MYFVLTVTSRSWSVYGGC